MADPATRPYRIELPNLIDDIDLTPYAFRLYAHVKRVAGPNGSCYEGSRKLAERCRMSLGQVSIAKKELLDKGLVTKKTRHTNGGETDELTPVDIWQKNFEHFSQGVHTVNTLDKGDQDMNTSVHTVNTTENSIVTPNTVTEAPKGVHKGVHTVNEGVHTVNGRRNHEERTEKKERERAAHARTPKQTGLESLSESVVAYKELTGKKQITPAVATLIADRVSDTAYWRTVVTNWCSFFRADNVNGMLDWYDHPEKMAAKMGYSNGLGADQAQGGRVVQRNGYSHRPANADIPNRPASSGQAEYERQYRDWLNSDDETEFVYQGPRL